MTVGGLSAARGESRGLGSTFSKWYYNAVSEKCAKG